MARTQTHRAIKCQPTDANGCPAFPALPRSCVFLPHFVIHLLCPLQRVCSEKEKHEIVGPVVAFSRHLPVLICHQLSKKRKTEVKKGARRFTGI